MKNIKDIVVPTCVLMIVAVIISGLLAFTYTAAGVANLDTGIPAEDLAGYAEIVTPEATTLVETKTTVENERLMAVYVDENKKAVALHVQAVGYAGKGSPIEALVGFDPDGNITGITIVSCLETPGLGTKIESPEYLEQYKGINSTVDSVNTITSATISSKALKEGVQNAMDIFEQVKGEIF